jgi:hypothetical protein
MSNFIEKKQADDISNWFRTVCKVKVGDVTANFPGVLALDYHTPVSEALGVLEELEIQSVAVCGPAHSFIGAGGVELISEGKQYIGKRVMSMLRFSFFFLNVLLVHRIARNSLELLSLKCPHFF